MQKKYSKMGALVLVVAIHLAIIYSMVEFGLAGESPVKTEPTEISVQLLSAPAPTPPQPQVAEPPKPEPPQPKPKTVSKPKVTPVKHETPKPLAPPTPNAITEKQQQEAVKQDEVKQAQEADETQKKEQVKTASASNAAPAPQGAPKTIDFSEVGYINRPAPAYPSVSRRLGEEGTGKYRVLIDAAGKPQEITIQQSSGYDRLDNVAIQAIRRATFKPHMENGTAAPVYVIIPIAFKL